MTRIEKNRFNALLIKAKNGATDAQFKIACIYSDGLKNNNNKIVVKQNYNRAYKWFEKAANGGDVCALNNLGNLVCDGLGCVKDVSKAIEIYEKAILKGYSPSANNLATIFRDKGNYQKAFEYHLLAEKIAKISYSFIVGLCYFNGLGVNIDKEKACKIFLKVSVDKQNYHSQFEIDEANYLLGYSYLNGEGVKKSLTIARKYLQKADKDNDHRSSQELLVILGRK